MKKTFALIAFIVLIVLVVVGYFGYKNYWVKINEQLPTPALIADWKTYSDNKQRYTIKYPGNWYLSSGQPDKINIQNYLESQVTQEEDKVMMLNPDKIGIVLEVYPNIIAKNEDLISWLKKNGYYTSGMSGDPKTVKQLAVSGYKGLILSYTEGDSYVFSAGGHVFYAYFHPYNSKLEPVFDQILSTFKLTQ